MSLLTFLSHHRGADWRKLMAQRAQCSCKNGVGGGGRGWEGDLLAIANLENEN